jgi:prepilin-type processing-associated H-X9-DG protein
LKDVTSMTDPKTETVPPSPRRVIPVIDYPTQTGGNSAAMRAMVFGLLGFVPFVTGVLAIRYGRRGLAVAAVEPRAGGVGAARAGIMLGVVSLLFWTIAVVSLPPALIRARRAAMYEQCVSHLRQIGVASMMYATRNGGVLPASLDDAIANAGLPVQVVVCPAMRGDASKPPASSGKFGNYSYVYLGAGRKLSIRNAWNTPLAYEPPTNHAGEHGEINVLYFDGHVATLRNPAAQLILALRPRPSPTAPSSQPASQPASAP